MEVTLEKESQPAERANPLLGITQTILSAIIWIDSCFTMSKMDRYKAGIDTSGEGRDDFSED